MSYLPGHTAILGGSHGNLALYNKGRINHDGYRQESFVKGSKMLMKLLSKKDNCTQNCQDFRSSVTVWQERKPNLPKLVMKIVHRLAEILKDIDQDKILPPPPTTTTAATDNQNCPDMASMTNPTGDYFRLIEIMMRQIKNANKGELKRMRSDMAKDLVKMFKRLCSDKDDMRTMHGNKNNHGGYSMYSQGHQMSFTSYHYDDHDNSQRGKRGANWWSNVLPEGLEDIFDQVTSGGGGGGGGYSLRKDILEELHGIVMNEIEDDEISVDTILDILYEEKEYWEDTPGAGTILNNLIRKFENADQTSFTMEQLEQFVGGGGGGEGGGGGGDEDDYDLKKDIMEGLKSEVAWHFDDGYEKITRDDILMILDNAISDWSDDQEAVEILNGIREKFEATAATSEWTKQELRQFMKDNFGHGGQGGGGGGYDGEDDEEEDGKKWGLLMRLKKEFEESFKNGGTLMKEDVLSKIRGLIDSADIDDNARTFLQRLEKAVDESERTMFSEGNLRGMVMRLMQKGPNGGSGGGGGGGGGGGQDWDGDDHGYWHGSGGNYFSQGMMMQWFQKFKNEYDYHYDGDVDMQLFAQWLKKMFMGGMMGGGGWGGGSGRYSHSSPEQSFVEEIFGKCYNSQSRGQKTGHHKMDKRHASGYGNGNKMDYYGKKHHGGGRCKGKFCMAEMFEFDCQSCQKRGHKDNDPVEECACHQVWNNGEEPLPNSLCRNLTSTQRELLGRVSVLAGGRKGPCFTAKDKAMTKVQESIKMALKSLDLKNQKITVERVQETCDKLVENLEKPEEDDEGSGSGSGDDDGDSGSGDDASGSPNNGNQKKDMCEPEWKRLSLPKAILEVAKEACQDSNFIQSLTKMLGQVQNECRDCKSKCNGGRGGCPGKPGKPPGPKSFCQTTIGSMHADNVMCKPDKDAYWRARQDLKMFIDERLHSGILT